MSIEDEAANYVDAYEAEREQERIDRQHPGEAPPLTSAPSGTITRITSGTVTFDTGPVWIRAAAFVKAARSAILREWVVRGAIEHGGSVEGPASLKTSRAPNRRERRAAAARAR